MQGLGNDFVVIAGPRDVSKDDVTRWCDRRTGIGADGVLVASPLDGGRVRMEYWNADGSAAEMCGNGLRCVARYAVGRGWVHAPSFTVETPVGPRPVLVNDTTVRALLGEAGPSGEPFDLAGFEIQPVSVGNPHAVIVVDDPFATPVDAVGPLVEGDPAFPERTNVEFVGIDGRRSITLRVWERGVGETLACGSGAAAAVVIAHRRGLTEAAATVHLLGGDLEVDVTDEGVWIEGPAEVVFSGTWEGS